MMPLKTDRPLAFFDIESTGTNVRTDRIIDLAIVKVFSDGHREEHTFRVNPERPIPAEASAVHGIYDKDVQAAPTFKSIAAQVATLFEGCDLGGYNILRFDIPLLCEEFTRAGTTFVVEGRRVVDPQRIFHQRDAAQEHLGAARAGDPGIGFKHHWQRQLTTERVVEQLGFCRMSDAGGVHASVPAWRYALAARVD